MYSLIVTLLAFPFFTLPAFADETVTPQIPTMPAHTPGSIQTSPNAPVESNITFTSAFGNATITDVLNRLISYAITIAGSVAAIMILWGAFQIMASRGDAKKYQTGRQTIIYALGGLIVIVLARGLVALFQGLVAGLGT